MIAIDASRALTSRRRFIELISASAAGGLAGAWTRATEWHDAGDFRDSVGLNGHFGQIQTPYVGAFDAVLDKLSTLGVRHMREDVGTGVAQGADAPQFARLRIAARDGLRFSLVCFDGVTTPILTPPASAPSMFGWCDGAVDYFEGANEPRLSSVENGGSLSAEHQRQLYRAVRSSPDLSDVPVLGPSYIDAEIPLAERVEDAVDFGNIHPYPGFEEPETTGPAGLREHVDEVRGIFGSKPVIVTETGYHTALQSTSGHLPVPPSIRARYLPRLLLWYFMGGIRRTYIYEAVSSFPTTQTEMLSAFGLFNNDLSETPSFWAVRNLLASFAVQGRDAAPRPLTVTVRSAPPDLAFAGFVRRDGVRILAFWRKRRGWDAHRGEMLPTERAPLTVRLSGSLRSLRLLRFGDDGRISTTSPEPRGGRLNTFVDDNLALAVMT